MDTKLLVIGDSHTNFWNGTGNWLGIDTIPGICTRVVPGALAYNLVEDDSTTNSRHTVLEALFQAIENGFDGWCMLGFGAVDCQMFIWQYAPTLGFEESVRNVVDRYVSFILQVKNVHKKLAIWAPVAAHHSMSGDTAVGTQVERNLAIMVFTAMLEEKLAAHNIPVLSMLEEMMDTDGRTREELYLSDLTHFSQALMPYALKTVNQALGLQLAQAPNSVEICEQRVSRFEVIDRIEKFDETWLHFVLPEGAQLLSNIAIWQNVFAEAKTLYIATSVDAKTFDFFEVTSEAKHHGVRDQQFIPIGRHARHIMIRGYMQSIKEEDVFLYVQASMLSHTARYHRASLLALRDAIVPRKTMLPLAPEASVIFTAPPSQTVIFSAPSTSILYDSAFDEQRITAFE